MRKSPGTNTLRQGTGFESRKKLNLRAKEVRRKFMQIKKLITESPRLQKLDNGHLESLELNIFLTNLHKFKGLKTDWKVQCRLNDNNAVLYDEDEASPARQTIVFCVLLVKAQQTRISRLWGGAVCSVCWNGRVLHHLIESVQQILTTHDRQSKLCSYLYIRKHIFSFRPSPRIESKLGLCYSQ